MKLFNICTSFLSSVGSLFHVSYEAMSVYINLYVQGGIFAASFLAVWIVAMIHNIAWLAGLYGLLLGCIISFFFVTGKRYHLPYDNHYAFRICVADLQDLAAKMKMSYQQINILIFIIFFLLVVVGNSVLFALLLG